MNNLPEKCTKKTEAILYHRKARFEELGYPCKLGLDYQLKKSCYKSIDYEIN
jgi:twinkle protein